MKRLLLSAAAALILSAAAFAANTINRISVSVSLKEDGSAIVQEQWDVVAESGTELYIERTGMGDMQILDFNVSDETGRQFRNLGGWDVNRTRSEKAGTCGINNTPYGLEMCWGFGEFGKHSFTLTYRLTNLVVSLSDYDYLHYQFIPEGLAPRKAELEITAPEPLSEDNTRIWGFGYDGEMDFSEGKVVAQSRSALRDYYSVIALMRFNKGVFSPLARRDVSFDSILNRAMDGADFGEREQDGFLDILFMLISMLVIFLMMVVPFFFATGGNTRRKRRKLFGMKDKDIPWNRDIPFNADIVESDVVSKDLGISTQKGNIASAIILRFVYKNVLTAQKDADDKVIFAFNRGDSLEGEEWGVTEQKLYSLLYIAAGEDHILQNKEFSKWAGRHQKSFYNWSNDIDSDGKSQLRGDGFSEASIWANGIKYTEAGKAEALKLFGMKKFLEDYTLIKERSTPEVGLWQEYMVFASLFGIADKVAAELKEIDPALYEQMTPSSSLSTITPYDTWYLSNTISRNIENARMAHQMAQARAARAAGGFGGHTSIGGGGGFSGGGHGGFR